jgi:hypothetical protein
VHGPALPDCRVYEQVSPVNKNGADAKGFPGSVQASPSGDQISYYSISPFPGACHLPNSLPVYLSSRGTEEAWGTEGLLECESREENKLGLSEDLSLAEVEGAPLALAAGATEGCNAYVRYTPAPGDMASYRWLAHMIACGGDKAFALFFAAFSGDDRHLVVESEEPLVPGATCVEVAAGAGQYTNRECTSTGSGPAAKFERVPQAFEANLTGGVEGQWSLVGLIPPSGEPSCTSECVPSPGGSVAGVGAYPWPQAAAALHEPGAEHFTHTAVSENGSLVFFTALPTGQLYVREGGERTVAVSAGTAHFRGATPEGSFAFYTEGEELFRFDTETEESEPVAVPAEGTGDVSAGSTKVTGLETTAGAFYTGEALSGAGLPAGETITAVAAGSLVLSVAATETHDPDALTGAAADVVGVLGSSTEGQAVYFAAGGHFAENAREYEYVNANGETKHASETPASETEVHEAGDKVVDLYEWYKPASGAPVTTFIARLNDTEQDGDPNGEGDGDEEDWSDFLGTAFPQTKRSRVSTDGGVLLFGSRRPLTGYENENAECVNDACSELFRYSAGENGALGRVSCVSCNPNPAILPYGNALLDGKGSSEPGIPEPRLTRNLSANGSRVFFETPDPLLPADTNTPHPPTSPTCTPPTQGGIGEGCDVYEWEADREGSCTSTSQNEGCLYLISSGTDSEQSYFGDASANGNDVFFFTRQALAPTTDTDDDIDVYDAHQCQKSEPCNEGGEPLPPYECTGEGCAHLYTPPATPNLLTGPQAASGNIPEPTGAPTGGGETHPLTPAQKLAAALKKCRTKHNKHKRQACEAQAHKHNPVKTATKKERAGR